MSERYLLKQAVTPKLRSESVTKPLPKRVFSSLSPFNRTPLRRSDPLDLLRYLIVHDHAQALRPLSLRLLRDSDGAVIFRIGGRCRTRSAASTPGPPGRLVLQMGRRFRGVNPSQAQRWVAALTGGPVSLTTL